MESRGEAIDHSPPAEARGEDTPPVERPGRWQLDFLIGKGLKPHHRLLEIGCGALRGGSHMIEYLDAGNYVGVGANQALLDEGYDGVLAALGLQARMPRDNLICSRDFELPRPDAFFDFAWAHSVLPRLTANAIRKYLETIARSMKPGATLFASFEEGENSQQPRGPKAPHRYRIDDLRAATPGSLWVVDPVGGGNRPNSLAIAAFTRRDDHPPATRALSPDEAKTLPPMGDPYRAHIGPADCSDFMGATQFSLLFANGLREHHRVLDFGCGSLRLGRLLMPYLRAGGYHGLEPNRWLIEEAIARETGSDIVALKRPSFAHNDDFDCTTFGVDFDFIIARSIITHAGPNLFRTFVDSARRALRENGLILVSVIEAEASQASLPKDGWFHAGCVAYTDLQVRETFATGGLQAVAIPWYHPRARWYAAAHPGAGVPTESERRLLTGIVLNEPQFADSLIGLR